MKENSILISFVSNSMCEEVKMQTAKIYHQTTAPLNQAIWKAVRVLFLYWKQVNIFHVRYHLQRTLKEKKIKMQRAIKRRKILNLVYYIRLNTLKNNFLKVILTFAFWKEQLSFSNEIIYCSQVSLSCYNCENLPLARETFIWPVPRCDTPFNYSEASIWLVSNKAHMMPDLNEVT